MKKWFEIGKTWSPVKKSTFRWALFMILVGGLWGVSAWSLLPYSIGMTAAFLLVALGLSKDGF